jgi:hypothetical protein
MDKLSYRRHRFPSIDVGAEVRMKRAFDEAGEDFLRR